MPTQPKVTYWRFWDRECGVFGPAEVVKAGNDVLVTTRDGKEKVETIWWTSRPSDVDGIAHCIGRIRLMEELDKGLYRHIDHSAGRSRNHPVTY